MPVTASTFPAPPTQPLAIADSTPTYPPTATAYITHTTSKPTTWAGSNDTIYAPPPLHDQYISQQTFPPHHPPPHHELYHHQPLHGPHQHGF